MAPPFKTVVKNHKVTSDNLSQAWKSKSLPARQWRLVESQLVDFGKGSPCQEFLIFLKAIDACRDALANSPRSLLRIGCSSGYYGHVLKSKFPDINYTGVDYSESFINFGAKVFNWKRTITDESFFIRMELLSRTSSFWRLVIGFSRVCGSDVFWYQYF